MSREINYYASAVVKAKKEFCKNPYKLNNLLEAIEALETCIKNTNKSIAEKRQLKLSI